MRKFDLCVIGSGPAGQKAAIQAAKLGRSVAVVEMREVLGGVAINTGTIPSKALREAILDFGGRTTVAPSLADFAAAKPALNRAGGFTGLMEACHRVIRKEIDLVREHFASNGITVLNGKGQFKNDHQVDVVGVHASETIEADHILVAVGTVPTTPETIPFDGVQIFSSDDLLKLGSIPRSIIVVGGGVIGTEYASMLAALGVRVTLIEGRPRLLDFVDAEITEALQYHLRQSGVTLRLGEKVVKIDRRATTDAARREGVKSMIEATLESGKTLTADTLLYAVGRQGSTDSLNLAAAGLSADNRGRITVNKEFQTNVAHIYAAGDVIGFPALASTSMEQGRVAACHMFGVKCENYDSLLPYGIYSIPEISMVGWTEEKLTADSIPYEAGIALYKETARGQLLGDEIGMLKMLFHQETRALLGVHIIGTNATELVHIGQCAMAFKATAEYFINTVFNYPTLAECYKIASLNGVNKLGNV
ncbi:MAG: Si-specific NAD(P)(+) transhydrogenase [Phycisphaeraceae bacterium]|nr:Si-specific NAD(P)(+) transhydrogenase [Phycisphaeraceae bacterium]